MKICLKHYYVINSQTYFALTIIFLSCLNNKKAGTMNYGFIFTFFLYAVSALLFSNSSSIAQEEVIELNKVYTNSPENFIHINKNCNVCLIHKPANAGCVVVNNGKILLVRDKKTKKLGLPGGKKNKHESALSVAQRKTLEETGLVVYIDDFVSEFKNGFRLYKCKIITSKNPVDDNSKILEMTYVSKKELEELLKKNNRKNIRLPHELDLIYSKFEWIIK